MCVQMDYGGALDFQGLAATLRRCRFRSNSCTDYDSGVDGHGGAVMMKNGIIIDSVFESNTALQGAGLYAIADVNVRNCTFDTNNATESGGGIYAFGSLTIENSIIRKCSASGNGAAVYSQAAIELIDSSIELLTFSAECAAVYHEPPSSGMLLFARAVTFDKVELPYFASSVPNTVLISNCGLNASDVQLTSLVTCVDLARIDITGYYCAAEHCGDAAAGIEVRQSP